MQSLHAPRMGHTSPKRSGQPLWSWDWATHAHPPEALQGYLA